MMRMDGKRGKKMKSVQPAFEGHMLAANSL
jgi:hypothetical protein